jgi:hypothetical protein
MLGGGVAVGDGAEDVALGGVGLGGVIAGPHPTTMIVVATTATTVRRDADLHGIEGSRPFSSAAGRQRARRGRA